MKFKRNPAYIDAMEFDGNLSNPEIPDYVKLKTENEKFYIFNTLHNSWIEIKIGDYYRTDIPGDSYPIDKKYMQENYTAQKAEKYNEIMSPENICIIDKNTKKPIGLVQSLDIKINANVGYTLATMLKSVDEDNITSIVPELHLVTDINKEQDTLVIEVAKIDG